MAALGSRRRACIAALQALYEADSSEHTPMAALERIVVHERLTESAAAFAEDLIQGVLTSQDETDQIIADAAPAWPLKQIAPVDRNILRLAIREMLRDNGTPVSVVINEAVELAKSFGSKNSAKFVHGVLGSVHKRYEASQPDQPVLGRG